MKYDFKNKVGLVCGGNKGIGFSLANMLLSKECVAKLFVTYRESPSKILLSLKDEYDSKVTLVQLEATNNQDYIKLASLISSHSLCLDFCINCIGVLSFAKKTPERQITDIEVENLVYSFRVNTLPSLLIAKHLKTLFRKSKSPMLSTLSAKVGSISDNKTGGWYGYRLSKAALNMALKNLSIEWQRTNMKSLVVAFHPGTTETKLSKPFIESAKKKYQVHRPDQSAFNIISCLKKSKNGQFLSWDMNEILW